VTDLSTAITSWRGTGYTAVLQAHAQQQAQVRTWLEAGRDQVQDRRLRNSCRWVLGGKAALYVVTSTADGPDRARMIRGAHAEEGETCFFPDPDSELGALGTRLPAANAYNRHNAADRANVVVGKNVNGWNKRGYVAITDVPMYSQAVFNQTLKHEVQHDADRHRETPIPDTPLAAKSYAEAVREYKTEYRAFFYQGGNDFSATHDPTNPTERHLDLRWTPRQLEIFQRIRQEYPVINKAAEDEAFVRDVNAYRNPDTEGFNKFSSPRIDDLYNRLHAVPAGTTNRAHQRVVDVLGVVDTLDADDIRYIRGQAVAVKLRAKIAHHLADDASDAFVERIVEMERRQAPPES